MSMIEKKGSEWKLVNTMIGLRMAVDCCEQVRIDLQPLSCCDTIKTVRYHSVPNGKNLNY